MAHMFLDVGSCVFSRSRLTIPIDNEFTQLMKGLQGERLRQAFKYLDKDQDGFIRPDEFKRIILVRYPGHQSGSTSAHFCVGNRWTQTIRRGY